MSSLPSELSAPTVEREGLGASALRVLSPRTATPLEAVPRGVGRARIRALVVADLAAIELSLLIAYLLVGGWGTDAGSSAWLTVAMLAVLPPAWLAILAAYRLYEGRNQAITPTATDELPALFHALLTGSVGFLLLGELIEAVLGSSVLTPLHAGTFTIAALALVPALRGVGRRWSLAGPPRRVLIVGAGTTGQALARKIRKHPEHGLHVIGFVDDVPTEGVVGPVHDLPVLVDRHEVDWLLVAGTGTPHERAVDLVRQVRRPDVQLSIVPSYYELFASNATMQDVEGIPVISLPSIKLSRPLRMLKRGFDLVAATVALVLFSPVLAVCAVLIKLDSPGPVLFRQARQGRNGRVFQILKLRTMADGAEGQRTGLAHLNEMEGAGPLFKMKADPRITRVGAFLRTTSLDELPQLWNVIRGDMSLVGPRPFVVHESEKITGWGARRLETTPGITGLWQVLGRNDVPFDEMVKLDYVYVTNWSLWWDIKILFQTISVVLARRGAY